MVVDDDVAGHDDVYLVHVREDHVAAIDAFELHDLQEGPLTFCINPNPHTNQDGLGEPFEEGHSLQLVQQLLLETLVPLVLSRTPVFSQHLHEEFLLDYLSH